MKRIAASSGERTRDRLGMGPWKKRQERRVKAFKRRFAGAPEGTAALFFIQIFSTLGFAVLYSTLVLYATKHLQLSVKAATMLMGVFGAFNYGLHLFGGYLGGRFLSNSNPFVGGMGPRVFRWACHSSA